MKFYLIIVLSLLLFSCNVKGKDNTKASIKSEKVSEIHKTDSTEIKKINEELKEIKDPVKRRAKYMEYEQKGMIGGVPRIALGQTSGKQNGLFLFDSNGGVRAKFIIDEDNKIKLEAYDEKGKVVSTWPDSK